MFSIGAITGDQRLAVQRAYLRLADTRGIRYTTAGSIANIVSHRISIPESSRLSNVLRISACPVLPFPYGYLPREILA